MSSKPTILLIGGTGKVASSIAQLLKQNGHSTILASRKGTAPYGFTGCRFDWLDSTTFNAPFENAQNITSVFLTAPGVMDVVPPMKAFIDFARTKAVKRFVLLSASVFEAGGPAMGRVHQYLIDLKVEYAVLRPSWFMGISAPLHETQYRLSLTNNGI
jgi:festuclavine dehydrogenase